MHYLRIIAFSLIVTGVYAQESATSRAIERGLTFLTADSLAWKESKKCASCHHAPMTLWALNDAKRAGYKVDQQAIADLTTWAVAKDDPAKLLVKGAADKPQARQSLFRTVVGLGAGDISDPAVKNWLANAGKLLAEEQTESGAWHVNEGRPPMIAGDDVTTAYVLLALHQPVASESNGVASAKEKALAWYVSQPVGEDSQAVALRLILNRRLSKPEAESRPLIKRIRDSQKPEGGWSQTPDMAADAYATGMSLYALAEAGIEPTDEAVQKAAGFLISTQRADGSWPMVSRPMKPGGSGAGNLTPIVHAGSAWGILGLVRHNPAGK